MENKTGFCDVCGRKAKTVFVYLDNGAGFGECCEICAWENKRQVLTEREIQEFDLGD
jgi:hypothetical protein